MSARGTALRLQAGSELRSAPRAMTRERMRWYVDAQPTVAADDGRIHTQPPTIHDDDAYARKQGLPGIIADGMISTNWIMGLLLDQLNANLVDRRMKITINRDVVDWIIDVTCKDRSYGARPLRRAIQRYVEDPLSEELIRGNLGDGEVEVYMDGGQISYRPAGAGELVAGRRLN